MNFSLALFAEEFKFVVTRTNYAPVLFAEASVATTVALAVEVMLHLAFVQIVSQRNYSPALLVRDLEVIAVVLAIAALALLVDVVIGLLWE